MSLVKRILTYKKAIIIFLSAFLLAGLTGCGEQVNSAGLTPTECAALEEFAQKDISANIDPAAASPTKFWNLEGTIKELKDELLKGTFGEVGSDEYEFFLKDLEKRIEERRQEIAVGAGEYLVTLEDGKLKQALTELANSPTPGTFGTFKGLANACNLPD